METLFFQHSTGEKTAYSFLPGNPAGTEPTVFFLGGHKSARDKSFCQRLWQACQEVHIPLLVFDWWGFGESSPGMPEGRIRDWLSQTIDLFEALIPGKAILIGTSMGALLAAWLGQLKQDQILGLIGRSSGFGLELVKLIQAHDGELAMTDRQGAKKIGFHVMDHHHLAIDPIAFNRPVRLLHALADARVHWQTALSLSDAFSTRDVRLVLSKDGDHSLPAPDDLEMVLSWIRELSA